MARCACCRAVIAFGGVREGQLRFCNKNCRENALLSTASAELPDEFVTEKVLEVYGGPCPKCGGPGPVDVRISHKALSALVVTMWRSDPQICCRSCGRKAKVWAMLTTGLLGWWGFPWGLLATPVQILRNVTGLVAMPDPSAPSAALKETVRAQLSARLVEEERLEMGRAAAQAKPQAVG